MRAQHDDAQAAFALNELCKRYWYPIYAYLRGRGYPRADAQDITQGFFLKAVTSGLIRSADHNRGKLRSFLLGSLNRHLASHHRHESAQKRGGRAIVLPLDCLDAEQRFAKEPCTNQSPESLYLAAWAQSLLERVRAQMRAHYERTGRAELYDALEPCITESEEAAPYRELAARLKTSEAALRVQVFRMRQRFGNLLRDEVALTVDTPEELEEELIWLGRVLRGG
jgi:RNA polymerase sigma-70 factor (ECF subfamily)